MNLRRFLLIYVIVLIAGAAIAFRHYEYPDWTFTGGQGATSSPACCPWSGPMQLGLLHVPREMKDRDSYPVVLVTGGKVPVESLRVAGDRALGKLGTWDDVKVPLADEVEMRLSGFFFAIAPLRPERQERLLRTRAPLIWRWEVVPVARGRRWLDVGGSVWMGDTLPLYFDVGGAEVNVAGTRWGHVLSFLGSAALLWLAPGALLPAGLLDRAIEWWQRRRRARAGYHR